MAAKVNTRFVVTLAGVIVLVFAGAAGTYLWLKGRTGDENERRGDAAMAAGNYKDADVYYAKAVNRQQNSVARLTKWREALSHLVPETRTVYEQKFLGDYTKVTRNLAIIKRHDVEAHRNWLQLIEDRVSSQRFELQPNLDLVTEVDNALLNFDPTTPGPEQALRRFSGRALVRVIANAADVSEAQITRAGEDLRVAIQADPQDVDSRLWLVTYHSAKASRAARARREEQELEFLDQARQALDQVTAAFPDHPRVLLMNIRAKAERILREGGVTRTTSREDRRERTAALGGDIRTLIPDLDAAVTRLAASDDVGAEIIGDVASLELGIEGRPDYARSLALARARIQSKPDDATTRNVLASMLGQAGRTDEAIAEYQAIIDMPPKPLGIEGLRLYSMKDSAVISKADLTLTEWFGQSDPAKKAETLEKFKKFRAEADARGIRPDVPALRLLDAKLKVAQEDWQSANKLLRQFFDSIGTDRHPDALLILSQVQLRLNQPGAAMASAEKLMAIEPQNLMAMRIHAQAVHAMEDKQRAIELVRGIVERYPGDEESIRILAAWEQEADPTKISDPVARDMAMLEAAMSSSRLSTLEVIDQLQAMAERHGHDPRVVAALAQALMENNDKAGAEAALLKGTQAHPESKDLARLARALTAEDTAGALVALLDESNLAPTDKALRKYAILRGYRRVDEASQVLRAEYARNPSDPRVLEFSFLEAIERRDVDAANTFAAKAQELDADGAEGMTYRARVFIMQDRMTEAAATLRQATLRNVVSPEAWRLLARVQRQIGRTPDAQRSYEEALRLRPNDRETLREFISFLSEEDAARALQVARGNERYAANDPAFEELLLRLEGRVGDKPRAIEMRTRLLERDPSNVNNIGVLASLYMDIKDYRSARVMIDRLREKADTPQVALQDARWYFEQRQPDQCLKVMEDYLTRRDAATLTIEPFLAFGQFLVQRGNLEEGLRMMQRGLPYQDPKRRDVDRTVGDTLANLGHSAAAADAYERVLEAGGDDSGNLVRLRLAEMYLRVNRCKDADELLTRIQAGTQKENATAVLLAADGALCVGDTRRARELLDRAVITYPEDPLVFVKRAEYLMKEPASQRDAMADLDAALRLRPGHARALQARASMHNSRGDIDKAVADLQALVKANPGMTDIRDNLIRDLLARDRRDQAVRIADDAIAARPGDIQTITRMSDLFRLMESYPDAARYALLAWAITKEYDIGIRCLEAILNDPSGNVLQAEEILRTFQGEIAQRPALIISRAKIAMRRNANNFSRVQRQVNDDLTAALDLVSPERTDQLSAWRRDVRVIYPRHADAAAYYVAAASRSVHRDWVLYFRAEMLLTEARDFEEGAKELSGLIAAASNDDVRVLSYRLLGTSLHANKDHERAAEVWKSGLAKFPLDWEMNNNLAYVYVRYLDKAAEALSYAEQAVKSRQESPEALDTLGAVYLALGRGEEARQALEASIARAGMTLSRIPPMIHLGLFYLSKGESETATRIARDVEAILNSVGSEGPSEYRTDLEELKKKIAGK